MKKYPSPPPKKNHIGENKLNEKVSTPQPPPPSKKKDPTFRWTTDLGCFQMYYNHSGAKMVVEKAINIIKGNYKTPL